MSFRDWQPPGEAYELVRRYIVGDPATRSKKTRTEVLAALDSLIGVPSLPVSAPESGRAHADAIREAFDRLFAQDRFEIGAVEKGRVALDALLADLAASEQAAKRGDTYRETLRDAPIERDRAVLALVEAREFIERARPVLGMSVAGSLGAQADRLLAALAAVGGAHQPTHRVAMNDGCRNCHRPWTECVC